MNRSSMFKRKIDFRKSHGSYLTDKDNGLDYLDFFGQYATLAVGYNHSIFHSNEYREELHALSHQKITNCEILSDESSEFDQVFRQFTSKGMFSHYHYSCTGALAVEAAIKTAMDYKGAKDNHRVISFKGSFHGINGYGGIITHRFEPVKTRLRGFPGSYWEPLDNPIITYSGGNQVVDEKRVESVLNEIKTIIKREGNVCSIIVEPIQCTFGDRYFPNSFFNGIRQIADNFDVPLIFDEIQVGFGGTGKLWYFENLNIAPDILVFGKKTQLSGIAVNEKFANIFDKPTRLEVTWDADIIDMLRCKYIIKAYKKFDVLSNVQKMAKKLKSGLDHISGLENIRNSGLIFAFDLSSDQTRDHFLKELLERRMLCNPTQSKTIRLRPNLFVTPDEIDHSLSIISEAAANL